MPAEKLPADTIQNVFQQGKTNWYKKGIKGRYGRLVHVIASLQWK